MPSVVQECHVENHLQTQLVAVAVPLRPESLINVGKRQIQRGGCEMVASEARTLENPLWVHADYGRLALAKLLHSSIEIPLENTCDSAVLGMEQCRGSGERELAGVIHVGRLANRVTCREPFLAIIDTTNPSVFLCM